MSRKERKRLTVMAGVKAQDPTLVQASELMAMCYRQFPRLLANGGITGLVCSWPRSSLSFPPLPSRVRKIEETSVPEREPPPTIWAS